MVKELIRQPVQKAVLNRFSRDEDAAAGQTSAKEVLRDLRAASSQWEMESVYSSGSLRNTPPRGSTV